MTCDVVRDLIGRHVRSTLAEDERGLVERHAATCAECREALADARALAAATALLPPSIEPARDLWPGVSARLAGPKRRPDRWRLAIVALAASIALVAGSSAVTLWLVRAHPARVAATTTPAIEAGYVNATESLMRALDAERSHLAPATVATLERNLGVIDAAIAESRAALAADPGNRDLAALLWASYRQKVALLQQATRLVERS